MSTKGTLPIDGNPGPAGANWRVNWPFTLLEGVLWVWSILVCVPFWQHDPNYSYGWAVPLLMFFFLWRRLGAQPRDFWTGCASEQRTSRSLSPWLIAIPGLFLFPLEVYREEYHQSGIVLWGINIAKVVFSVAGAWWLGGRRLVLWTLFPLLFFLTAVPWPARIAQPLQQNLMFGVAGLVTETMLWLGIPVKAEGAVLYLSKGSVGIAEACSGIRSLQSGLMVSLAVGELLWLGRTRRAVLVGWGILLALVSNFARTFVLCWIVEHDGTEAMNRAHDLVGNVAMYSLYILIFAFGKVLARGVRDIWPTREAGTWRERIDLLRWDRVPDFRPLLGTTVAMFVTVHAWYYVLMVRANPQTEPQFVVAREADGVKEEEFDELVARQLGADVGQRVVREVPEAPLGEVSAYHLFWKPSPMSRLALQHRPDICMPGGGWRQVGDVSSETIEIDGHPLQFSVFHFENSSLKAVQMWGVWRNGRPVEFDWGNRLAALPERYGPLPTDRHMLGVELISGLVQYQEGEPPVDVLRRSLPRMFHFRPYRAGSDADAAASP